MTRTPTPGHRDTEGREKVLGAALKRGQRSRHRRERSGAYKRRKQKGSNWKPWTQGTLGGRLLGKNRLSLLSGGPPNSVADNTGLFLVGVALEKKANRWRATYSTEGVEEISPS